MSTDPNEFEVPEGYGDDIGNPLEGEGVRLPFEAPYIWWVNGKNGYRDEKGARYFGGWAMSDEAMARAAADNSDVLPLNWTSYPMTNDEGESYTAFLTRIAYVAILGTRFRWVIDNTGKGKGQYQVLAYLGYEKEKKIIPFSPVVLTTKGSSGQFLRAAVNDFAAKTSAPRKKFANNLPVSAFYAAIGTFGPDVVTKAVGKEVKKIVTPLSLWLPTKMDEGYLRAIFVGKEIAALTAQLRKEATEWLAAWKVAPNASAASQTQAAGPVYADIPEFAQDPPLDDDFPT